MAHDGRLQHEATQSASADVQNTPSYHSSGASVWLPSAGCVSTRVRPSHPGSLFSFPFIFRERAGVPKQTHNKSTPARRIVHADFATKHQLDLGRPSTPIPALTATDAG